MKGIFELETLPNPHNEVESDPASGVRVLLFVLPKVQAAAEVVASVRSVFVHNAQHGSLKNWEITKIDCHS